MKGFKMNIQLFADEQTGDSVPVKYVGQEALEELVTKMKAYTDAKGIPTINQNDIRITDYDAGIYIWHPTSAGDQNFGHKIYYNGTAGTEYASISGAYLGDIILLISKSRTGVTANTWVWALLCADYDLVMGYTTANSGSYKSYVLTKFVQHQDVINNLTTSTFVQGKALHARQGKVLKDLIDDLTTTVNGKQDILTFDTNPTENSANPVTSGGLYTKFNLKADKTAAVGSFDLSIDNTTYVVTLQAKDVNGNNLGTAKTIDLPLESVVVSGSYDSTTKKVILTLKDGSTIDFSVADLISGLQTEITSTNKLSADLVDDTSTTHKFVSATDISNWNNKQNAINNNSKLNADLVDDTGTTNKFVTASDITNWNSKQNALTFDDTPTNGSNNPVKSGGIYTALAGKQNTLVAGTNITIDPTTNTISATGGASITVDSALSTTSENPVQNKVITEAINAAQNTADGAVAKNTEQDTAIANAQSTAENALNVANGAVKTADLLNLTYPVGSIFLSLNNTSPASLFGGTWERLKGRFLLGASDGYTAGATGGEETHKLTINEMPSHTHKIEGQKNDSTGYHHKGSQVGHAGITEGGNYWSKATTATGGGQAHNNMPPYLVVYMWKRTA